MITRTRNYVTESWAELRKVMWPTRSQVVNLTLIVIGVSALVGAYIAVLDLLLLLGMDRLLTP
jgi:preprotein translocase subunit SecE